MALTRREYICYIVPVRGEPVQLCGSYDWTERRLKVQDDRGGSYAYDQLRRNRGVNHRIRTRLDSTA